MNLCTNRLLEDFGWRGTLLVTSGIALNGVPCGLALPQTIRHEPEKNYEGKKLDTCSMLSWCSNMKHVLVRVLIKDNVSVFRNVHPLSFMLCSFAYGLAYYVPFALLPRQAVQLGMTDYEAAWLISTTGKCDFKSFSFEIINLLVLYDEVTSLKARHRQCCILNNHYLLNPLNAG